MLAKLYPADDPSIPANAASAICIHRRIHTNTQIDTTSRMRNWMEMNGEGKSQSTWSTNNTSQFGGESLGCGC